MFTMGPILSDEIERGVDEVLAYSSIFNHHMNIEDIVAKFASKVIPQRSD